MPVTSRTPLGAATHVRKWWVDVNAGSVAVPAWLPLMATENTQFNPDNATVNDITDNDAAGWKANQKDGAAWQVQTNVFRKTLVDDPTSYDPGQEFVRLASIGKFGADNTFQVRVYEMEPGGPRVEAYLGLANSSWQPQAGGPDADENVQVMLNGNGILTPIAHPDTGAAVPTVVSASGVGATIVAAGGDLVLVTGNRLLGATDVKFGATSATKLRVLSDGRIAAVAPAHAAGTVAVTVINGAGTSVTSANIVYV